MDVVAQTYTAQRQVATETSGTASSTPPPANLATAEKSEVQRRLDAKYLKFGGKPKLSKPGIATENIAQDGPRYAPEAAPGKSGNIQQALAEKKKTEAGSKSKIRQTSVEKDAARLPLPAPRQAPAELRRQIERPVTRQAVSKSRPVRGLLPSLFARKKNVDRKNSVPRQGESADAERSQSVQQHLKKLYARDGLEMPSMDLNQLPGANSSPASALPKKTLPQRPKVLRASNPQTAPVTQPIRQVSDNPFKRLIKRITPFRKKNSTRSIAAPPEAVAEQRALQNGTLKSAGGDSQQQPSADSEPVFTRFGKTPVSPRETPAPSLQRTPDTKLQTVNPADVPSFRPLVELPEALPTPAPSEETTTLQDPAELKATPIVETPEVPTLDGDVSDDPYTREVPLEEIVDPVGAAFPSVSEDEADQSKSVTVEEQPGAAETESPQPEEGNPFTGLILDVPVPEPNSSIPAKEKTPAREVPVNDTPLLPSPGVSEADLAVPEIRRPGSEDEQPGIEIEVPAPASSEEVPALPTNTLPTLKPAKQTQLQPVPPEQKPADSPEQERPGTLQTSSQEGPHADKLKRIAARTELQGLKGFCPVQLREHRELRDAQPQFSAEYDGVVYNCCSQAALQKFMAKPYLYAPAAGGRDVLRVAAGDGQPGGSLDHAVWYRDRLYLFQSPESLQTFVAAPARFVSGK